MLLLLDNDLKRSETLSQETLRKRNVKSVTEILVLAMRLFSFMFVTAVCVLFLIKLHWLRTKSI